MNLNLRPVRYADAGLLWQWRNDPDTYQWFLADKPVSWDEHLVWFRTKLRQRSKTRIWLLTVAGSAVGMVRYDKSEDNPMTAHVSYSVASEHRGKGYGTALLRLSASMACEELGLRDITGAVWADNEPSVKAFRRAGWDLVTISEINGRLRYIFEWRKG